MAEKKTVKVKGLGVKALSLPHSDVGTKEARIDRVVFNKEGVAEVPADLVDDLLHLYPQNVVVLG